LADCRPKSRQRRATAGVMTPNQSMTLDADSSRDSSTANRVRASPAAKRGRFSQNSQRHDKDSENQPATGPPITLPNMKPAAHMPRPTDRRSGGNALLTMGNEDA
jgi:hypothetical protein